MKRFLSILISLILLISLCGCGKAKSQTYTIYGYFDTVITLTAFDSKTNVESFGKSAESVFAMLHRLFDPYQSTAPDGVYAVMQKSGEWVNVSAAVINLVQKSLQAYEKTEGRVNFAAGALTSLWKDAKSLPTDEQIRFAKQHISPDALEIDTQNKRLKLNDPHTRLDFGAVAKGYAFDMVAEMLKASGFTGILSGVSSVCLIGDKNGEDFSVGVQKPGSDEMLEVLSLRDTAFATSGTDQRFTEIDGKKYHHIIDPATGKPADSKLMQASVVDKSAFWADVYATDSIITGILPDGTTAIGCSAEGELIK